jgi:alkylation response protein AidB-like acyl-CoA dehydrogenase
VNFDWSADEIAFRAEVRAAIERHTRSDWSHEDFQLGTDELVAECLAFCAGLSRDGLLTPNWPEEFGGRDASPWEQLILSEEMHGAGEPRGPQYMNVNWIGGAIMSTGTEEQRRHHLPLISSGAVFWCQGFSEPDAGSDLAALRTSAVRDGDEYLVNGQKIWTSYAHVADYCFLLVRTDPDAERHHGISVLLVPMDLPGIEVRAIPNISGGHMVHEMFFTDVRVPATCLLGSENEGWGLVIKALANERIGIARFERTARVLDSVVRRATEEPDGALAPDAAAIAGRAYAINEAARILNYVAVDERIIDPDGPRPRASVSRVATVRGMKAVAEAGRDILGARSFTDPLADQMAVAAVTTPIASGSYEMQLNNIARLCLDLPRK